MQYKFVKGTAAMPPNTRGATDPTLTRRRVSNAHSDYQLFRKAVGSYFILKKTCIAASLLLLSAFLCLLSVIRRGLLFGFCRFLFNQNLVLKVRQ